MGLSQPGSAIDKKRVVGACGIGCHRERSRMGKFIGRPYNKGAEGIFIIAAGAGFGNFLRGVPAVKRFRNRFSDGNVFVLKFVINHHMDRKTDYLFESVFQKAGNFSGEKNSVRIFWL